MAKKEATATATAETKAKRVTNKEKAMKHIERCKKRGVLPMTFEAILTAYAAIGLIKYDDVMEMSEQYADTFIDNNGKEV